MFCLLEDKYNNAIHSEEINYNHKFKMDLKT